jgi:branched-chain amino acid transport system ATP-binding protein
LKVPAYQRTGRGVVLGPEGRELWPQLTVPENLELGAFPPHARPKRADTLAWVYELFPVLRERAMQVAGSMSGASSRWSPSGAR